MRHMARLIVSALVLLGVMTAGAFAASVSSAPAPQAGDLPAIVTALPAAGVATTTPDADTPGSSGDSAPTSPAKPAAKHPAASSSHPTTRSSSSSDSSGSDSRQQAGGRSTRNEKDREHEVVTPQLHETDEDGHDTEEQDHPSGD
jgi:hypothetical protein